MTSFCRFHKLSATQPSNLAGHGFVAAGLDSGELDRLTSRYFVKGWPTPHTKLTVVLEGGM